MSYTKPEISGYNDNPPPDNGTTGTDNEITWSKHKSKFADPLKTYADAINDATNLAFAELLTLCFGFCLKNYKETVATNATATGAVTIDLTNGNVHNLTLTGNVTFTFSNPATSGKTSNITLVITQDDSGGKTITWPASVKWEGGTAPTLTTTADVVSILTFFTTDGGTIWYGFLSGDDMS